MMDLSKLESGNAAGGLRKDDPRMVAWEQWKKSEAYENSRRWALHELHVEGSLWNAFITGWIASQPAPSPPLTPAPTGETTREYENTAAEALADIAAGLKRGLAQPRESEVAGEIAEDTSDPTDEVRAKLIKDLEWSTRLEFQRHGNADGSVNVRWTSPDFLLRLLRQRTEAGQSWLPIESAPKDGTRILVDFGRVGVHAVSWTEPDGIDDYRTWCVDDEKFGPYPLRRYVHSDVRGWMPLPTAPQAQGGRT